MSQGVLGNLGVNLIPPKSCAGLAVGIGVLPGVVALIFCRREATKDWPARVQARISFVMGTTDARNQRDEM